MGPSVRKTTAKADAILSLRGVACTSCFAAIERKLKRLSGISDVNLNYVAETVTIDYDPSKLTADEIRTFIGKIGYDLGHR